MRMLSQIYFTKKQNYFSEFNFINLDHFLLTAVPPEYYQHARGYKSNMA